MAPLVRWSKQFPDRRSTETADTIHESAIQAGPVISVQLLAQREDAGDAADVVGELLGFVAGEGAAEEGGLAVAQPLFEDLLAGRGCSG